MNKDELMDALRMSNEALSGVIEWQEGNDQSLLEEPSWVRDCRLAMRRVTRVIVRLDEAKEVR